MRKALINQLVSHISSFNMRTYSYADSLGSQRAMALLLDGKALAERLNKELRNKIKTFTDLNKRPPSLRCILVGEDPASMTYVNNKIKTAEFVGIDALAIRLPNTISEDELIEKIENLNSDDRVDGVLVQLPLPEHLHERRVCNTVSPLKDVDGFHFKNVGNMCIGEPSLVPATPLGVIRLIKESGISTFGKNVVVIGRSKNVGMPVAMLLHSDGRHSNRLGGDATVTICHRYTPKEQLDAHCRLADIIVTATGVPKLLTADMVKPGAVIIDVGITRIKTPEGKNKLVGDCDFEDVRKVAGAITPVPGGVGPMTVAMLMENTFQAATRLK